MNWKNIPIQNKLMIALLATSGAVLAVTCASFAAYELVTVKQKILERYATGAQIIAANSTAALAFRNEADAAEVLSALKTDPGVIASCVYDNNGKIFARYPDSAPAGLFPLTLSATGYRNGHLDVFCPVVQGGRTLGMVYLQANLNSLTDRYRAYAWLSGLVVLTSIILVYFLSRVLQKQILAPVLTLARTARQVSKSRDFSVRAQKASDDELGRLTEDFNRMLTEIQEQNEAIVGLNTNLERRIAERTAALEATTDEVKAANQKLTELDRMKTDFFNNVSHELRTPLTLILAPLEAMMSSPETPESEKPTIQMAHQNATRLLQMVNGLLDFSKLAEGKVQVKRERTQVRDLTRSLFMDFKALMDQKGIRGEMAVDILEPFLEMDRYLYERILFNLLSNAIKFTPAGGSVFLNARWEAGRLTLVISDTGIGMSRESQKNLFQRFYQAEGSSTRRFEGTGLGLAMVKEFAQLLGGTVEVESRSGEGSAFTVILQAPVSVRTTKGPSEPPQPARASLGLEFLPMGNTLYPPLPSHSGETNLPKVLVAEDNPELARFISKLLWDLCETKAVSNGVEALALVKSWSPDLVLSDVMMPQMDGLQLTRALKADPSTQSIPVVLLTAMTNREDLMKGWEAGADDYLFKPFHPKELEARIRSLLSMLRWREKSGEYRRQRDTLEQLNLVAVRDLRESLRETVGLTKGFEARLREKANHEGIGSVKAIVQGETRMLTVLDAWLDYAKNALSERPKERIHLATVAQRVIDEMEPEIRRLGALITLGEMPFLRIVPDQMELVFHNLFANSLKFRREGVPPEIRIEAKRREEEWIISVKDNGIGFDPADAEKIFHLFVRLYDPEVYPGQGVGLPICRKIVESHGGRIWAEGRLGEGSTFYFTLSSKAKT